MLAHSVPATGEWELKIVGQQGGFVFGVYRRQMKAIGYLAQLDRLFQRARDDAQLEHDRGHRATV